MSETDSPTKPPEKQVNPAKEYIGDGVYVAFDGFGFTLTTENGIATTNTIYLEPSVYAELREYVDRLRGER